MRTFARFHTTVGGQKQGRFYVGAGGICPPPQIHLLPPSQIQKLADHSDVISKVAKCAKIQIFRSSAPDPAGGAYSSPQASYLMMRGSLSPAKNATPAVSPCVYGSQGP